MRMGNTTTQMANIIGSTDMKSPGIYGQTIKFNCIKEECHSNKEQAQKKFNNVVLAFLSWFRFSCKEEQAQESSPNRT